MRLLYALMTAASLAGQSLDGVVDIHAHSGPDVVPRSIDALSAAKLAKARGLRAIVLKNHYEATSSLATLARKDAPGLQVFGGIALNRAVGGVNLAAVERMAKVDGGFGRVVWMPTFDSENQVRVAGEKRPFVSVSRDGKLLPEVLAVIDFIGRNGLVLATGHSTPAEVLMLVREGRARGVKHIVVTHGALAPVSMTAAQMREAASMGAYVEFVGNSVIGNSRSLSFQDFASAMRAVGLDHVILSSDLGQAGNPLHCDGLDTIFAGLRGVGFSIDEIGIIAMRNPARLLGLE